MKVIVEVSNSRYENNDKGEKPNIPPKSAKHKSASNT